MMTKNQFCKMIVRDAEKRLGRSVNESDILSTSCLAVAMAHLDLIHDEELKSYAYQRGGVMHSYFDYENGDIGLLSVREIIELLPDVAEDQHKKPI